MNPEHTNPAPAKPVTDREEPEIAEERDIPTDDKTADGNRWARGESGADSERE